VTATFDLWPEAAIDAIRRASLARSSSGQGVRRVASDRTGSLAAGCASRRGDDQVRSAAAVDEALARRPERWQRRRATYRNR
jgi:hypothetical protein